LSQTGLRASPRIRLGKLPRQQTGWIAFTLAQTAHRAVSFWKQTVDADQLDLIEDKPTNRGEVGGRRQLALMNGSASLKTMHQDPPIPAMDRSPPVNEPPVTRALPAAVRSKAPPFSLFSKRGEQSPKLKLGALSPRMGEGFARADFGF
jgi:hypothetical protein